MIAAIGVFLAPYLFRIILYASIAAAVGGGFLYVKLHYENIGYNKAVAEIALQDERAVNAIAEHAKKVTDCYGHNGEWDTSRGVCHN